MNGVNDTEAVRELLARAVEEAPVHAGDGSATVFATARRVRRRRRAVVTGAVAAVAAAGLLGSGTLPGGGGQRSVAAARDTRGAGIEKLLPEDVGKVREVSLQQLMTGTKPKVDKGEGPYDGDYAVTRGGATGYLLVHVIRMGKQPQGDLCALRPMPSHTDVSELPKGVNRFVPTIKTGVEQCTTEKLSGGRILNTWRNAGWTSGGILHGPRLAARLMLKDGTAVLVEDFSGFTGRGSLGPVMKGHPLTLGQLRTFVLRPELLP
jgi:hypothetical protein